MISTENLLSNIPECLEHELLETLSRSDSVKIERIVSEGQGTPDGKWYDQEWAEWVLLIQGEACLLFEEGQQTITLKPMDHVLIPAHKRHRVEWTAPNEKTVWLAVHYLDT